MSKTELFRYSEKQQRDVYNEIRGRLILWPWLVGCDFSYQSAVAGGGKGVLVLLMGGIEVLHDWTVVEKGPLYITHSVARIGGHSYE